MRGFVSLCRLSRSSSRTVQPEAEPTARERPAPDLDAAPGGSQPRSALIHHSSQILQERIFSKATLSCS